MFFCQSLYPATLIHSQSRMIKITFCSLSFRSMHANQLDSGVLLVYSALFCCHPASFRYIPVPGARQYHFCLFQLIPVSFRLVPAYFGLLPIYSALFVCHSGSFRYIPVPFLFIPVSSRLNPAYSGLFRYIPFRSCV